MRQALLSLLRLLLFVQGSHRPHGFQVFLIFYLRIQDQTDHLMKYSSFVLESLYGKCNIEYDPLAIQIHRNDVFARDESGELISLLEMGEIIS